uniref:Alanine dehydrogenase n=1 Tax=Thermosporothrix sp. COM3 TaxID=2490863 RepID=A0A455SWX9_9CHLR|nr:alanine dehydrogenase [Thermosporothrix sp. COM3]
MALILREDDVRSLLSMHDTVAVLEEAFNAQSQGMVVNQPRSRIMIPNGVLNTQAAAAPTFGVLGYKTYTAFREGVRSVVLLFSAHDGSLLAIIEAEWLGAMRTGAASALATKYLARPDAHIVGLIGAGKQAVTQLMGVCALLPALSTVLVYCRQQSVRELFCQEMSHLLNLDVRPVLTAKEAVEYADILITATTSRYPVFEGAWLKPGCHINAIGSNWAQRRELDSATIQHCSLVVTDSLEQACVEAGDLIIPANEGLFDLSEVHELSEIVSIDIPWRETPDAITLYKGVGIALEDIITAAHVYYCARQHNRGEEIQLIL